MPAYNPTASYGAFQAVPTKKKKATRVNPADPRYGAGTSWPTDNTFVVDWADPNDYGGTTDWGAFGQNLANQPNWKGTPGQYLDIAPYMPDYIGNVEGDWEYTSALADMNEANRMQDASTREAIQQLAIGFGGDLSSLIGRGLIDQNTVDLAGRNEFSTMKELGRALDRGNARTVSSMAARGGLGSGAETALRSQLNENYQRQSTAALNALTAQVSGAQNALAQGVASRQMGLNQVKANVANRLYQQAMSQARPGTRAKWNPDLNAYEAPDGRLYNANGTLISGY